jgi:hypothetical protein
MQVVRRKATVPARIPPLRSAPSLTPNPWFPTSSDLSQLTQSFTTTSIQIPPIPPSRRHQINTAHPILHDNIDANTTISIHTLAQAPRDKLLQTQISNTPLYRTFDFALLWVYRFSKSRDLECPMFCIDISDFLEPWNLSMAGRWRYQISLIPTQGSSKEKDKHYQHSFTLV